LENCEKKGKNDVFLLIVFYLLNEQISFILKKYSEKSRDLAEKKQKKEENIKKKLKVNKKSPCPPFS